MSKNWLIAIVVIALATAGYYYTQSNQVVMVQKDAMTVKTDDIMMEEDQGIEDGQMMEQSSRYQPFTPAVLAESSSNRRILYFYANWCPTCAPTNIDLEQNASLLPSDVTVIRVNYNDTDTDEDEKALATKYGITYQHTFVQINESGEVVTQWNGGSTAELLAKIK